MLSILDASREFRRAARGTSDICCDDLRRFSAGAPTNGLSPVLNLSKSNAVGGLLSAAGNAGQQSNGRMQLSASAGSSDLLLRSSSGGGMAVAMDSGSEAGADTENDQASAAEDEDFSELDEDDQCNVGKSTGEFSIK